jgi:transposase InsO family protein
VISDVRDNYYSPGELIDQISQWVNYYNNHRHHEAIDNAAPADKYHKYIICEKSLK